MIRGLFTLRAAGNVTDTNSFSWTKLWNSFYWCQPLPAVCSLPYQTSSSTCVLPCPSSDAIPAPVGIIIIPALPELPILPEDSYKPQRGCTPLGILKTRGLIYFQGLFWLLVLLWEELLRDLAVLAGLGKLGLLLTDESLESWPERPRARRPVG